MTFPLSRDRSIANAACKHCGKTEEEHCEGYEKKMPDGCQCDPWEWGNVTPICAQYVGNGKQNCATCEHDAGCHATATPSPAPARAF